MKQAALIINWCLLLWMLATCSMNARETAIRGAYATANAASTAFSIYNKRELARIVDEAPSYADGEAKLIEYITNKQTKIYERFAVVYQAIALAALSNDGRALEAMLLAIDLLKTELKERQVIP